MKRGWMMAGLLLLGLRAGAAMDPAAYASLRTAVTGGTFVVHAIDKDTADKGVLLVERIQREICSILHTSTPPAAQVYWFTDGAQWTNCLRLAGLSGTERSLAGEDFIAIGVTSNDANEPLAHELVHASLKQTAYYPLPLWLEEGFSLVAGWRAASAVARQEGQDLRRRLPALTRDELLPFSEVLERKDYPADPLRNRAYYRQTEELVRYLIEMLGEQRFFKLALHISRGDTLRHCLERRFNYGPSQFEQLEEVVRVRATSKQSW